MIADIYCFFAFPFFCLFIYMIVKIFFCPYLSITLLPRTVCPCYFKILLSVNVLQSANTRPTYRLREAAQNNGLFFSGPATKPLPSPLLVAGPLKKDRYFFCGFPYVRWYFVTLRLIINISICWKSLTLKHQICGTLRIFPGRIVYIFTGCLIYCAQLVDLRKQFMGYPVELWLSRDWIPLLSFQSPTVIKAEGVREAAKIGIFFSGPATKALPPPLWPYTLFLVLK